MVMRNEIPPQVKSYRWLILLLCCMMVCGRYYSFDIPAAVYDKLEIRFSKSKDVNDFVFDFSLMYTYYCAPNIFLPLFGGHLIDKFGQRTMMIVFASFAFIGQFIVSFGCSSRDFRLILWGRLLFGIGESLNISIITILSSYFAEGELAFVVIVVFLFSRFCLFLNLLLSPIIEVEHGVSTSFWVGTLLCCLGVVASLILSEVDETLKSPYNSEVAGRSMLNIGRGTHPPHTCSKKDNYHFGFTKLRKKSSTPPQLPVVLEDNCSDDVGESGPPLDSANNIIAELKTKQDSYGTFDANSLEGNDIEAPTNEAEVSHTSRISPFRILGCLYFLCFMLYGAILPFFGLSNPIIRIGYLHGESWADLSDDEKDLWVTRLQAIPVIILTICAPLIAVLVDYYGHRTACFVAASVLLAFSHALVASEIGNLSFLVVALILIGLAHGITVAVVWTCVQYMIPPQWQGGATGVLLSVYHLSQSLLPIFVSHALSTKINYVDLHLSKHRHKFAALQIVDIKNCEAFFVALSLLGLFFSLVLFILDESNGAVLRLSGIMSFSHNYERVNVEDNLELQRVEKTVAEKHRLTFSAPSRPRSKSMSDTAPLASCMRKYYIKQRSMSNDSQDGEVEDKRSDFKERSDDDNDNDIDVEQPTRRRCVSFTGDCDFTHERKAGQGQHPPIQLAVKPQPSSPMRRRMFFSHF